MGWAVREFPAFQGTEGNRLKALTDALTWFSTHDFTLIETWVNAYALLISIYGVVLSTPRLLRHWKTRHIRRVWGIQNGDPVIVICSELDDPERRQAVEPREFIYFLKYGDIDAHFEVVVTLLRLYPAIKIRVMSAGEAANSRIDLASHLVLIGGPDYNQFTDTVLEWGSTRFRYRSPHVAEKSTKWPREIVLLDCVRDQEFCHDADAHDYGYFERIQNRHNPDRNVILIGGCHTTGVTGAVKAFSMADSEHGEIPKQVLTNARRVSKRVRRVREFAVLISADRVGQTISTPIVTPEQILPR